MSQGIVSGRGRPRGAMRRKGHVRGTRLRVELLEGRSLLTLSIAPISAAEGIPFGGRVASFDVGDVQGTLADFRATITWGDGRTVQGSIVGRPQDGFDVFGSNTYAIQGAYPVGVTVTGANGSSVAANGVANVVDALLSVAGTTINPTAGSPFTGVIAVFTDSYPGRGTGDYTATITLDDGQAIAGTVGPRPAGGFQVVGTFTFGSPGPRDVGVTVTRILDGQQTTASGRAVVAPSPDAPPSPALTATGRTIVATGNQPVPDQVVASFTTDAPTTVAADYVATISWGDGHTNEGVVSRLADGTFQVSVSRVRGTNTYEQTGTLPLLVTITRLTDNQTVTATGQVSIVDPFTVITGGVAPVSDTGPSNTDGVTSNNQPTLQGTAEPFAQVRLFAQRSDVSEPVALGQVAAGPDGSWRTTISPLADGEYTLSAVQIPAGGFPRPAAVLGRFVIDTAAPRVIGLTYRRPSGLIDVVYRDDLSGLARTSLVDPLNYTLIGPPVRRVPPSSRPQSLNVTILPSDPAAVRVQIPAGLRGRRGASRLRIISGPVNGVNGVTDSAGNALDGEYRGSVPSGDGLPGGHFVAPFAAFRGIHGVRVASAARARRSR